MTTSFYDPSSNFHPYECDGTGMCIHCDRLKTDEHDPEKCALCMDSDSPNPSRHEDEQKEKPTYRFCNKCGYVGLSSLHEKCEVQT